MVERRAGESSKMLCNHIDEGPERHPERNKSILLVMVHSRVLKEGEGEKK